MLGYMVAVGCSPGQTLYPKLDADNSLHQSPTVGVVSGAYVPGLDNPKADAKIITMLRGADRVKILAISPLRETVAGHTDFWFNIEAEGVVCWVFGANLVRFGDELQARYAAERLHQQLFEYPDQP